MRRPTVAAAAVLLATIMASRAEAPTQELQKSVVRPLTSADVNSAGQPIVFPQKNGHITAAIYEIPPGAVLPEHKHPFPRLGYVLAGTLRVTNTERATSAIYKTGDLVLESVDLWHRGENYGSDQLRLLVIDLCEKGIPTTIMRK